MQSTASAWFCALCGAANDVGQSVCFSCNRARTDIAQASAPPDNPASLLQGRYRLASQVGVGGFGEVYKALDTQQGERVVAIKQINLGGLSPQKTIEATDTFNRELHILAPLKHPNLPRIYDHFTDPDHWYLVMEFLEGETLERYLEDRQRQRSYSGAGTPGLLPLEEIFALAFQLCDVLGYLHERQPPIIFRDLKPANIMRNSTGHISLIDFGIARHFRPGRMKDTTPLGSPGYAAPEQYGKAQTSARSDLYSLGALLHYLVTGNDPSETPFQFAPLPQLLPTSMAGTRELEALIWRMVDTDSSQRPASAREVKEELQRIAHLVAGVSQARIWTPPPGQPPDPEIEGAFQQQIQLQLQKHRATTRRKFIRRSLLAGGGVIAGGALLEALFSGLLNSNREWNGPEPGQFDQGPGSFRGQENIANMALSPRGNLFVTVTIDNFVHDGNSDVRNIVQVYRLDQNGFNVLKSVSPGVVPGTVSALAWSPDNARFAMGFSDGTITVWNIKSGGKDYSYHMHTGALETIAWSPDGEFIASAGLSVGLEERLLIANALFNGSIVSRYTGTSPSGSSFLSWSPDSTRVVTLYDLQDGQPQTLLQVWDVQTSKTLFPFGTPNVLQVAWSPDGNTIAAYTNFNTLFLYNASNGQPVKSYPIGGSSNPSADTLWPLQLLWSPDSQYLALDTGGLSDVQILNVKNGSMRGFSSHFNSPRVIRWLPGRSELSLIDAEGEQELFNVTGL